jgi:hypothetical protein
LLLDPHWVCARWVPWEPLVCLKDTRQRLPSAHGGNQRACFPMRDPNLPWWWLFLLGPFFFERKCGRGSPYSRFDFLKIRTQIWVCGDLNLGGWVVHPLP